MPFYLKIQTVGKRKVFIANDILFDMIFPNHFSMILK